MHTHRYQITIVGDLNEAGRQAFEGFKIEESGDQVTVLIADLDQAALYGALHRVQVLGLELFSFSRLADGIS